MLDHPPAEATRAGPVTVAWPTDLVRGDDGCVRGFLMPRVDLAVNVPLFQVYNPQSRRQVAPAFTWRYLVRTARNVAAIVNELHGAGYVVGDLNESNLLVSRQALVTLVDCDSIQVRDPATGATLRCLVGKADFLAPEFQGRDLSKVDRTERSDGFALAILIFLLLMEGVHPYAGVWRGRGEAPDLSARLRARRFPRLPLARMRPPPTAVPLRVLPWRLRALAMRSFVLGATVARARPNAAVWVSALERLEAGLRTCARSPHHEHPRHLRRCPWCARIDLGLPDPFPGPTGTSSLTAPTSAGLVRARRAARLFLSRSARSIGLTATRRTRNATPRTRRRWVPRAWRWAPPIVLVASVGALAPVAVVLLLLAGATAGRGAWSWFRSVVVVACASAPAAAGLTVLTSSAALGGQVWGATVGVAVAAVLAPRTRAFGGPARAYAIRAYSTARGIAVVRSMAVVAAVAVLKFSPTWWPVR